MHAYVQFGWLPQIYRDAGLEASTAGGLMALAAGTGIFGAMLMPSAVSRMQRSSALMIAFPACSWLAATSAYSSPRPLQRGSGH